MTFSLLYVHVWDPPTVPLFQCRMHGWIIWAWQRVTGNRGPWLLTAWWFAHSFSLDSYIHPALARSGPVREEDEPSHGHKTISRTWVNLLGNAVVIYIVPPSSPGCNTSVWSHLLITLHIKTPQISVLHTLNIYIFSIFGCYIEKVLKLLTGHSYSC